jgi:chromosome segregation ATPase
MPKPNTRTDIELATEIGQGLLSEVRRMQTLLSERQSTLNQLTTEKQEHQSRIQHLVKQLRFKSETEEKLKQELWDLELAKQDLNSHVNQLSAAIQKAQLEQNKRDQQDSLVQQELQVLKQAQDQWREVLQKTQSDYEVKLTQLHQSLSQLTYEKDSITQQLDQLKEDHAQVVPLEIQEKPSEEELRGLQVSLAQANHVVETLQIDLEKEKTKKQELDQLLRESQETIEHLQMMEMPVHPLTVVPDSKFRKVLPFVMRTMMGEWMFKYTRYRAGHHRFFWLHPYTKTLYWSQQEPSHGGEYKAKSGNDTKKKSSIERGF